MITAIRSAHSFTVLLCLAVIFREVFDRLAGVFVPGYYYGWNTAEAQVGTALLAVGVFTLTAIVYCSTVAYGLCGRNLTLGLHLIWLVILTLVGWYIDPRFFNQKPWHRIDPAIERTEFLVGLALYAVVVGSTCVLPTVMFFRHARVASEHREKTVAFPGRISTVMTICSAVLFLSLFVRVVTKPTYELVGDNTIVAAWLVALALAVVPAIGQNRFSLALALGGVFLPPVFALLRSIQ